MEDESNAPKNKNFGGKLTVGMTEGTRSLIFKHKSLIESLARFKSNSQDRNNILGCKLAVGMTVSILIRG
jgi:hypothetical protein